MKNRVVVMYMRVGTAAQLEPDVQKKYSALMNVEIKEKKKKKIIELQRRPYRSFLSLKGERKMD